MIPVLYAANATDFTTNGIGRLTDTISCVVTEERNGVFELEMEIATTSPYFSRIEVGSIIGAVPYKGGTRQAFEVYQITKPQNEKVTVNATHISYRASYIPVAPFVAQGITAALNGLSTNTLETNPFSLSSDITNTTSTLDIVSPRSLRACLGGTEGSLLDTFGGEYFWDNWDISLLSSRGSDNGVYLRYGKNITELTHTETIEDTVTGCLPYWTDPNSSVSFYGDIQYSSRAGDYAINRTVCLDLSSEFEMAPSNAELNAAGLEWITAQGLPNESITLSFIDLSTTGEQAVLEQVNLCDTIHVIYSPLNITFDAKVIKTVWNVLADRYEEIEIGNPKASLAKTLSTNFGDISSLITTGKKLVSVTQTINTDIGEIQNAVATVSESLDEVNGNLTTEINTLTTKTNQNAEGISAQVEATTRLTDTVTGLNTEVTKLGTYVDLKTDGLHITQNTDGSYVLITDSGMEIFVRGSRQAYATVEGFNASAFITGDWHIVSNGDSLNFFKKS